MKKYFIMVLVFLFLIGCGEEINLPEAKSDSTHDNSVVCDSADNIIQTSTCGQRIVIDGNTNQILFYDENNLLAGGITAKTNAGLPTLRFNAFDALFESAYLRSSGHIISEQSIIARVVPAPQWKGELNSDPTDGISGDRYYNITTNKEKVFIKSKNKWVNSN